MCVAILQKEGKKVKDEYLDRFSHNNGDGFGLLYVDNDVLHDYRTMDYPDFKEHYHRLHSMYGNTSPFVLHFRLGTAGRKNITNCHPFMVHKDLGFVHNGVIGKTPGNVEFSDTYMFNEQIMKNIGDDIFNTSVQSLVKDYINYNKLIFLHSSKQYVIINEQEGAWEDDIWYSTKAVGNTYNPPVQKSVSKLKCDLCGSFHSTHMQWMLEDDTGEFVYVCINCLKNRKHLTIEDFIKECQTKSKTFGRFIV